MEQQSDAKPSDDKPAEEHDCDDCGQLFKSAQGLAGHRRLAHSTSTQSELDAKAGELAERETAAKRREAEVVRKAEANRQREAEVARRQQEIAETGPSALGMVRCPECGSWFEDSGSLHRHTRTLHPIEDKVAEEVSRGRERVASVWREAVAKAKRNPEATDDQIVGWFWAPTDRKILRLLLAKNATFRPTEG